MSEDLSAKIPSSLGQESTSTHTLIIGHSARRTRLALPASIGVAFGTRPRAHGIRRRTTRTRALSYSSAIYASQHRLGTPKAGRGLLCITMATLECRALIILVLLLHRWSIWR